MTSVSFQRACAARRCRITTPPSGFTIIEVAAAVAVFAIVAAGLSMNTIATVRCNHIGQSLSAALALAQDQLEQLRALDPAANPPALTAGSHADPNNPISALGSPGGPFTRQWTVTRNSPMPGVSTVTLTVSATDGPTRTVQLWTYICQTPACT